MARQVTNPTSIHLDGGSITGLAQWVKDSTLLWLWHRPAAAAPIQPLAWELPYAAGVAIKGKKKKIPLRKQIILTVLKGGPRKIG